ANANGASYATFDFKVQDNGGTANGGVDLDPTANTITIDVTSVNDAPSGTDKTITILEDGSHTFVAADFGFSDPNDSPANAFAAVKITSLPGAGTLKLLGVSVTLNQVIPVADLGDLVFTPAANANGAPKATLDYNIHVTSATANGGVNLDPTANTITIDVTSVNDAPSATDNTITILEDVSHIFVSANFGSRGPTLFPYTTLFRSKITSLPGAGTLKLLGVSVTLNQVIPVADLGDLVFTPAANAN